MVRKHTLYNFSPLQALKFVLWFNIWSILENVPCAHEKNMLFLGGLFYRCLLDEYDLLCWSSLLFSRNLLPRQLTTLPQLSLPVYEEPQSHPENLGPSQVFPEHVDSPEHAESSTNSSGLLISKNMSEIFKASCGHPVFQLSLPKGNQLPLIVLDKLPQGKAFLT